MYAAKAPAMCYICLRVCLKIEGGFNELPILLKAIFGQMKLPHLQAADRPMRDNQVAALAQIVQHAKDMEEISDELRPLFIMACIHSNSELDLAMNLTEDPSPLRIKVLLKQGKKDQCLDVARLMVGQNSESPELWLLCHLISGDEPYLFKAYALEPSSAANLNALIAFYLRSKQYSKLIRVMRVAQGLDCHNPFVIAVLAVLQGKLGNVDEARVLIGTSMIGAVEKAEMEEVSRVVQGLLREMLVGVLMGHKDELVDQIRGRVDVDELILDNLVQRVIKAMADSGVKARDHFKGEFAALKAKFEGTQLDRLTAVESLVFNTAQASVSELLAKLTATENLTVKKLLILSIISQMVATKLDEADFKTLLESLSDKIGSSLKFKALAALIRQRPSE